MLGLEGSNFQGLMWVTLEGVLEEFGKIRVTLEGIFLFYFRSLVKMGVW